MLSKEDIRAIKRAHPVADVVAGYGIHLRRSGRSLVGRCPFHHDQGRPLEPVGDQPKYLGLPGAGRKPLLGWEARLTIPHRLSSKASSTG